MLSVQPINYEKTVWMWSAKTVMKPSFEIYLGEKKDHESRKLSVSRISPDHEIELGEYVNTVQEQDQRTN
jgi:hypothetical protein